MSLLPIEELNSADSNNFFQVVHLLFETAPPLASALWKARPFSSYENLIAKAEEEISKMTPHDRLLVINAHPRIGTNPQQVSSQSYKEQGYDKEKEMERKKLEQIYHRLKVLNDEYEKKFGFMFVVFVNGRSKEQIIPVLEQRLKNENKEEELALGLSEMMAIAKDRLKKLRAKV